LLTAAETDGVATALAAATADPSTFTPRDVNALRIYASPCICAGFSDPTLISRFTDCPFGVVPFRTAAGGCPATTSLTPIGVIPNAESAGNELAGSCTGIADVFAAVPVDVAALVNEAGVGIVVETGVLVEELAGNTVDIAATGAYDDGRVVVGVLVRAGYAPSDPTVDGGGGAYGVYVY